MCFSFFVRRAIKSATGEDPGKKPMEAITSGQFQPQGYTVTVRQSGQGTRIYRAGQPPLVWDPYRGYVQLDDGVPNHSYQHLHPSQHHGGHHGGHHHPGHHGFGGNHFGGHQDEHHGGHHGGHHDSSSWGGDFGFSSGGGDSGGSGGGDCGGGSSGD